MALYTSTVGMITNMEYQTDGCSILFTLTNEEQGQIQVLLPSNAYVLNMHPFQMGERVTFFYASNAPMTLIYPPRYTAAAAAYTPQGMTAVLEMFNTNLTNQNNTLTLTPAWNTPITLPNGQTFANMPGGNLLLATYTSSTRSIPAQAIPEQVVVFCGNA